MTNLPGPDGKALPEGFEEFYAAYIRSVVFSPNKFADVLSMAIAAFEAGAEWMSDYCEECDR